MNPACRSWKPNSLTLYRLFCQNALCQNSVWNVFKGNQLEKCQEKANQTAGFSSTCATQSLDSIQQSQMDSPATQLRGDTSPGYFNSYSLSPSCPSIFKLLLAVVVFSHSVKEATAHSFPQPFCGYIPLHSHAQGKRVDARKGLPGELTRYGWKPLAPLRFGNRLLQ